MTAPLQDQATMNAQVLYMALELSGAKWRAAFATHEDERTRLSTQTRNVPL